MDEIRLAVVTYDYERDMGPNNPIQDSNDSILKDCLDTYTYVFLFFHDFMFVSLVSCVGIHE